MLCFTFSASLIFLHSFLQPQVAALYIPEFTKSVAERANGPACNTSAAWLPNIQAYADAKTDQNFVSFYSSHNKSTTRLDSAFGSLLGELNYQCGVETATDCVVPDCFSLQNRGIDPWVYLAANSFENLNAMFDVMFQGFNIGTDTVQNLVDDLADKFFKWKDPVSIADEVSHWLPFVASVIAGPWAFLVDAIAWKIIINASPAFVGATTAQIAQSLGAAKGITRNTGIDALHNYIIGYSNITRTAIDDWSDSTFAGHNDSLGHALPNYIAGGRFVNASAVPHVSTVATFYQTMLTAKIINMKWRAYPVYIISTTAKNTQLDSSLNGVFYNSPTTKRLYVPYYYKKSKQIAIPDADVLNGDIYNIKMSQVTESSAKSWEVAGYNYTDALALTSVIPNATSNATANPWTEQASWQGVFRIPVCDVGDRNQWIVPYGSNILPCCCGPNCVDTAAFIRAANLNTTGDWLKACKKQLQGTDLNFNLINYGINS